MGAPSCLVEMSNNILLIGSDGFLGKNVKKIFQDLNNNNFFEIKNSEDLNILNYDDLLGCLNDNKIYGVINCAAFVGGISYGYKYQADLLSINSQMAINLYKASHEANIKMLVNQEHFDLTSFDARVGEATIIEQAQTLAALTCTTLRA